MKYTNDYLDIYTDLEKKYLVIDSIKKYKSLVWSNGNATYPIQRWFQFKEAYSLNTF